MQNKINFKSLLLMLCMMLGGGNLWADTYEQLTSIADIDESAEYVLGVEGTGFHYEGTSSWGKCALPSAKTPIYYTLTKASDGTSFTAQATINGTTYYLQIPTSNGFGMATSAGTNTDLIIGTTKVSGTNYAVANKTTTDRHLRINGTNGLRSYAGDTGTMAFFYKRVVTTTPTVTFNTASKSIAIGETYTQTAVVENASDAVVAYSSSNTSVATVNASTGEVTAVAAGTVTITATITVGGVDYTDTYTVTVVAVQDGVFDFTGEYDYGSGAQKNGTNMTSGSVFTAGNITLTTAGSCAWYNNGTFRVYSAASYTLAAPEGYVITSIAFAGTQNLTSVTASIGEVTAGESGTATWTGKAQTVTITRGSANPFYNKITVTYEEKAGNDVANLSIDATKLALTGQGTPNTATIAADVEGLSISYDTTDDGIAKVSETGVVTAVSAGTATITATWAEQTVGDVTYDGGSKEFEVTVYAVDDGVFDFTTLVLNYGTELEPSNDNAYITEENTWTAGNVTLVTSGKYRWWSNDGTLRLFAADEGTTTATLSVPDGKVISKIVITGSNLAGVTANVGTYADGTWTGKAKTVVFTRSEGKVNLQAKTITVTYEDAPEVYAPEFSVATGVYTSEQTVELTSETEGATIYYTLDGTEPTTESTEYTAALTIFETTTIKAIAVKDGEASAVSTVTLTFRKAANIAELKTYTSGTTNILLTLTDAQVYYVYTNDKNKTDMYIGDDTGAIDFYTVGLEYTAGQILNGTIVVTYTVYNSLPEVTAVSENNLTATEGTAVPVAMAASDITLDANVCQLVEVTGTYTDGTTLKVGDLLVYNKFKITMPTLTAGDKVVATGIIVPYDGNPELALISIKKATVEGDVDGNGTLESADLDYLIQYLLGKKPEKKNCDVNGDGEVTLSDVTKLVDILIEKGVSL